MIMNLVDDLNVLLADLAVFYRKLSLVCNRRGFFCNS